MDIPLGYYLKPVIMPSVPFITLLQEASNEEKYLKMTLAGSIFWIGWARCSQKPAGIFTPGKQPIKVKDRGLFCYWAVRELGLTMADLAPKLNISQPAVSMSAQRGERIESDNGYSLMDE